MSWDPSGRPRSSPSRPAPAGPGASDARPCGEQPVWSQGEANRTSGCQFHLAADGKALLPDPACSPGGRNALLTRDVLCSVGWPSGAHFTTDAYRNVPEAVKTRVYAAYNIPAAGSATLPLAGGGDATVVMRGGTRWEIDHIRALEDGGTNGSPPGTPASQWNLGNLYPQPASPSGDGFHEKDQVETYVHNQMCARSGDAYTLSDADAEALAQQMVEDWTVIYDGEHAAAVRSLPQKQHTDTGDETGD